MLNGELFSSSSVYQGANGVGWTISFYYCIDTINGESVKIFLTDSLYIVQVIPVRY